MRKSLTIVLLSLFALGATAQSVTPLSQELLLERKQYDEIINRYLSDTTSYSAKTLYNVGLAYYYKNDDTATLRLMDRSIEKNPNDPRAHFIKGSSLGYLKRYNEAVTAFKHAIQLDSTASSSLNGLGEAYYNLGKKELALETLQQAILKPNPSYNAFVTIAQIYTDEGRDDKALAIYYEAKDKVDKQSDGYADVLYDIAIYEQKAGNHKTAEPILLELISIAPEQYYAYPRLIQAYHGLQQYDKAKEYKKKMYEFHDKGLLQKNLADMFCFEQFKWKDKLIQCFERYQEQSKSIFNKHLFYVTDSAGNTVIRIQTEYSPFLAEQGDNAKYILCASKGSYHATYGYTFKEDFKYEDLKNAVIAVLEEKITPAASSNVSPKKP